MAALVREVRSSNSSEGEVTFLSEKTFRAEATAAAVASISGTRYWTELYFGAVTYIA